MTKTVKFLFTFLIIAQMSLTAAAQEIPKMLKMQETMNLTDQHKILELAPPMIPAPQTKSIADLAKGRPIVLLFVDLSRPSAVDEAKEFNVFARTLTKAQPILIAYGKTGSVLAQSIGTLQDIGFSHPIVLDSIGYFAFALAAFRPPHYAVLDGTGRLMINKVHSLASKLQNGTPFKDVLAALDSKKPIPVSNGEQIVDITSLKGEKAPNFSISKALVGSASFKTRTLQDVRKTGKPALVVFWMATCPHCQREMPRIWKWYQKHSREVELITITNLQQKSVLDYATNYLKKNGLTDLPVYTSSDEDYKAFRVQAIPSWALIGKSGVITEAKTGELPDLESVLDRGLAAAR